MKNIYISIGCLVIALFMASCEDLLHEEYNPFTADKIGQELNKDGEKSTNGSTHILQDTVFQVNGVSFKMIRVEGGTFSMGTTDTKVYGAQPVHQVNLSTYYIAETEVTQELYKAVMGNCPSSFNGKNMPVGSVSRQKANSFIDKLRQLTGFYFALPTEAQWEFAARGGNNSRGYIYSGSNDCSSVAVWVGNAPRSVKSKMPNELGIYDMSGNVEELCYDWYGEYSSANQVNPKGATDGSSRVVRGGSYEKGGGKSACHVCARTSLYEDKGWGYTGLRLAIW